jgi:hypothetical protein
MRETASWLRFTRSFNCVLEKEEGGRVCVCVWGGGGVNRGGKRRRTEQVGNTTRVLY